MAALAGLIAGLEVVDGESDDSSSESDVEEEFVTKLFGERNYDLSEDKYSEMRNIKEALKRIWSLIERNGDNGRLDSSFPYMKTKDVKYHRYSRKDYWLCFLNHFYCESLKNYGITITPRDKSVMKEREKKIGLSTPHRTGPKGWFNRLCFGVRIETKVKIDDVEVFFDDKNYYPFLSSKDTFADRFQALMFEFGGLDCHPKMNFAELGERCPHT
mmetsp:Transcript_40686/g.53373  ORF Transcript_40686/g.53373 Transcript_40686/m.53373 type:complete len:215 (-) Transcript_40686:126-770(-)